MGFLFQAESLNKLFDRLGEAYRIFAPAVFSGGSPFSDADMVRYGTVTSIEQVVFDRKSQYSFKEALMPITQSLFFFTEDEMKEADPPRKGTVVFARHCDLHALKRLDDLYLRNGPPDPYYQRMRERTRFVLLGCAAPFEGCFCGVMGTNRSEDYDAALEPVDGGYAVDCKAPDWAGLFASFGPETREVIPSFTEVSNADVRLPGERFSQDPITLPLWDEYDGRCISCGRCTFACPTCTCYTMQDLFYSDNGRVGERRRVWASCMVDGFTDVAGGGAYRQKNSQRMRFKTLHKIVDHKKRFGRYMCVGCGRCDGVCPEYISFARAISALEEAVR
jgi:anaerobic sulfite reductase subunit A